MLGPHSGRPSKARRTSFASQGPVWDADPCLPQSIQQRAMPVLEAVARVRGGRAENLPIVGTKNGPQFRADIYIAVESIVSRQTNGQVCEATQGLQRAQTGILAVVGDFCDTSSEDYKYLMDGVAAQIIQRELPGGIVEHVPVTVGATRVIN